MYREAEIRVRKIIAKKDFSIVANFLERKPLSYWKIKGDGLVTDGLILVEKTKFVMFL